MIGAAKRVALKVLTLERVASLFEPLTRDRAVIFFMHRFADPATGSRGHDVAQLRAMLGYLRRRRFSILPLAELLARLAGGTPLYKTVAFTVDDGYDDFHRIAVPAFAEFDSPVTLFVVTGFLDGHLWMWWDRVDYVFRQSSRSSVALDLGTTSFRCTWDTPQGAATCRSNLVACLKLLPENDKLSAIGRFAESMEVSLPPDPPPAYRPLTWNEVREDARRGVTFGPHTVTHPILSRATAEQSRWEIEESWRRLRSQTEASIPVFCYPNGDPASFSQREVDTVGSAGLEAAVVTYGGYARARFFHGGGPRDRYAIPRFPYLDDPRNFVQVVAGIERLSNAVSGLRSAGARPGDHT